MSDPGRLHVDQEEAADLVITPRRDLYPDEAGEPAVVDQAARDSERYDQRIKAGQSRPRGFTIEPPDTIRLRPNSQPETWYTLEAAAQLCDRSPKTLANLISKYQLPRRLGWRARNRKRRRAVLLNPPTVAWLQRRTLLAPARDWRPESSTRVDTAP